MFEFLNPVLDTIFGPLLHLPIFFSVLIISLIVSLIITFCYKWFTDQDLMKRLKEEMKELQKEIKELKDRPDEAMKIQKKAMETNMKYMMNSFKPTLITIIPIILIFGWMNANLAYEPISPDIPFTVNVNFNDNTFETANIHTNLEYISDSSQKIIDETASWQFKGPPGEYMLKLEYNNMNITEKKVIIGDSYETPLEKIDHDEISSIEVVHEKKKVIPIFGGISWFWSYIIFSILFSTLLRKILKIY